jgi:hypothetical protein
MHVAQNIAVRAILSLSLLGAPVVWAQSASPSVELLPLVAPMETEEPGELLPLNLSRPEALGAVEKEQPEAAGRGGRATRMRSQRGDSRALPFGSGYEARQSRGRGRRGGGGP